MLAFSSRNLFALALVFSVAFAAQAQPTAVDSVMQGKEYKLPPLDSTYRSKASGFKTAPAHSAQANDLVYMIQFDALADFDAAQARRADLQRRTGMSIQLIFDEPFYKLRAGSYSKKEDAEDQVRQLSEANIQAFLVKSYKDRD